MIKRGHRHADAGLSIVLERIPGLTKRGLLKKTYRFQYGPLDEFGWDSSHSFGDYDTIKGGQFTREGGRQLRAANFRTLTTDFSPRFAAWAGGDHHAGRGEPDMRGTNPQEVDRGLQKIVDAGSPLRLRVWNRALYANPMLNMPATLRSLTVREQAGEPDAHYYDLSFVEYRNPKLERRGYGKPGGERGGHELPAVVRVDDDGVAVELAHGEDEDMKEHQIGSTGNPASLRELAKHFYGETSRWTYIAAKNGITNHGPNENLGNLVQRGRNFRRLTIPRMPTAADLFDIPSLGQGPGSHDEGIAD